IIFTGCATTSQIGKQASTQLLNTPELKDAHVGISIFDADAKKSLYNYQGNKYFVPASSTKLFATYAALKYLGDSIPSIMYFEDDTALYVLPLGDPTFLHKDFLKQPVVSLLQNSKKKIYISQFNWKEDGLGYGWSWDDYNDDYSAERSSLPVYGNVVRWIQERDTTAADQQNNVAIYSVPEVNWKVRFNPETVRKTFGVKRNFSENIFFITEGNENLKSIDIPFVTNGIRSAIELLRDTIGKEAFIKEEKISFQNAKRIRSQPLDSMLRPMMYRSDNFFAEQSLLMVSQQVLGYMDDQKIIDTLLKSDLKSLPQKPRWVDGSGLSRFNQITPDDFVWLLNKMKDDFGLERMKNILPSGGQGTLRNYYKSDSNYIFAKTGSLTGQLSISGYLYTLKNKLLIFSVLVNNHNASAANIRRQVEAFLHEIRSRY
ncbi:MAG TPA: D-alanyl-D-alanine carboxypeptidase, partial [Chitinophagaceae bacterium]|nr:D-alanyl-D-alanine carboxypeptidase [Chitinophagaceae bacterium]